MATEYGRKSGSYSTAVIGRWELVRQDIAGNYSVIRSHLYFYYGGSTSVGSSSSSFGTMGVTLYSGSYRFYPGETYLGYTDFTVYHNADGTFPATNIGFWAQSYHISSGEVWGTIGYRAVPDIPRQANVTGYNDFNDEQNPTITYNNPGGFRINARLEFAGTNIRRDNIPNTGSYTFNLTDDERKLLRQKCTGNSMTVRGVIATCIGGTTENYWSYWDRTMTIVNGNPTFDNFNFADVNEKTIALTGDNTSIIKGYSNIKVTIPSSMKATANKEATMSKYRASIGTANPVDITYSSDNEVSGIVNNADSSTINVYAIDSRNNSKLVSKQATNFINYNVATKGNIDVLRTNGVSEDVTLKINGTYSNIDFGQVVNSIKSAQYRYRIKGTNEWSDYKNLSLTTSGNNFSYDGLIKGDTESLGFDVGNSYDIEVLVKDELSEVTFTDTLGSGIPNIALHKNGVGIMGKYDEEVGGLLQVGGKCYGHNIMTIYSDSRFDMSSNNKVSKLTKYISVGDKLKYGDSSIIIGKGVSKILVSANFSYWKSKNFWQSSIKILKNNSETIARCWFESTTDIYETCGVTTTPILANVQENDEISLYFNQGSTQEVNVLAEEKATFLTVEVIE